MPPKRFSAESRIADYYFALRGSFGPQHWWPARTVFEVIVGAYLTQNTSWTNVTKAMESLQAEGVLSVAGIRRTSVETLEQLIRSAGYFRQKARALKAFVTFLDERYRGSLKRMFAAPTEGLRQELLELRGVGPETADSILLYAGQHASFVVDAYTRRVLARHGLISWKAKYDEIKTLCEEGLQEVPGQKLATGRRLDGNALAHPPSRMSLAERTPLAQVYNEMHGLLVSVGKRYCLKSRALCEQCPLQEYLPPGGPIMLEQPRGGGKAARLLGR